MSFFSSLIGAFKTRRPRVASGSVDTQELFAKAFLQVVALHDINLNLGRVANTNSMVPVLDENCVLITEHTEFDALTEGDIVIYVPTPGLRVVHRLYERCSSGWVAKGDNNGRVDYPWVVTPGNLESRVVGILYGKRTETTDL